MLPAEQVKKAHVDDRKWLAQQLAPMPFRFSKRILSRYFWLLDTRSRKQANLSVVEAVAKLPATAFRLNSSNDDVILFAKRKSEHCRYVAASVGNPLTALSTIVSNNGLVPPAEKKTTESGRIARMKDEYWWRRGIRKTHGRNVEAAAIQLGFVNGKREKYASNETVQRRYEQKTRNRQMLEAMQAVNELGESFTLQDLVERSVSHPVIRRCELMTRMAGFEQYANEHGHIGIFVTLTCPSRMHAYHQTGKRNHRYDDTTPREANQYLAAVWSRIRSALKRHDIAPLYGFRVAEPHHDGTPHWHMLVFIDPEKSADFKAITERYALAVDGDEPGAEIHRCTFVDIDKRRGTATGYIAKYVAKNIDGYGLQADLFGDDPHANAKRVDAWASTWGIRQFQQIGGPSVTVWRELRRVDSENVTGELAGAVQAADAGDWSRFISLMQQREITLERQTQVDRSTGEIKTNRYGEPQTDKVIGVRCGAVILPTRIHQWTIKRGVPAPWSSVNNCTRDNDEHITENIQSVPFADGANGTIRGPSPGVCRENARGSPSH